jgi:hypothetical protein
MILHLLVMLLSHHISSSYLLIQSPVISYDLIMNPIPNMNAASPSHNVPAGYTVLIGPDNQQYLVPSFMVETTRLALEVEQKRSELNIDAAAAGVTNTPLIKYHDSLRFLQPHPPSHEPWAGIAEGDIQLPADPVRC